LLEFLKTAIAAGNEKVIDANKEHILTQLKGVVQRYKLLDSKVASHDLEDQIAASQAHGRELVWNAWMMHKTRERGSRLSSTGRQVQPPTESHKKMSAGMSTYLLQPLCESLRLPPRETHALMQSYFCEAPARFNFIVTLEEKMLAIEAQATKLTSHP
jgi:hypothetical protein